MRTLSCLIIGVLLTLSSFGQSKLSVYNVIYSQQQYSDLTNDSILWENVFWVDSSYKSKGWIIPLTKNIFNPTLNYAFNSFSYSINSTLFNLRGYDYSISAIVCNCFTKEFSDTPPYQTKVSYKLDTSYRAPILKFQLKNLGIADNLFATKGKVNIQWWFYDGGDFEIRYGESNIDKMWLQSKSPDWGGYKPTIGAFQYVDTVQTHNMALVGDYNNPKIYNGINKPFFDLMHDSTLSRFPPSGTIYRFTTTKVGLSNKQLTALNEHIYPNPFINEINISNDTNEPFEVFVTNELGKSIGHYINQNSIDTQLYTEGLYIVTIKYKSGVVSHKKLMKLKQ